MCVRPELFPERVFVVFHRLIRRRLRRQHGQQRRGLGRFSRHSPGELNPRVDAQVNLKRRLACARQVEHLTAHIIEGVPAWLAVSDRVNLRLKRSKGTEQFRCSSGMPSELSNHATKSVRLTRTGTKIGDQEILVQEVTEIGHQPSFGYSRLSLLEPLDDLVIGSRLEAELVQPGKQRRLADTNFIRAEWLVDVTYVVGVDQPVTSEETSVVS